MMWPRDHGATLPEKRSCRKAQKSWVFQWVCSWGSAASPVLRCVQQDPSGGLQGGGEGLPEARGEVWFSLRKRARVSWERVCLWRWREAMHTYRSPFCSFIIDLGTTCLYRLLYLPGCLMLAVAHSIIIYPSFFPFFQNSYPPVVIKLVRFCKIWINQSASYLPVWVEDLSKCYTIT